MSGPETPGVNQPVTPTGDKKGPIPGVHGPAPSALPIGIIATNSSKKAGTLRELFII